jgi:hypothetical protein
VIGAIRRVAFGSHVSLSQNVGNEKTAIAVRDAAARPHASIASSVTSLAVGRFRFDRKVDSKEETPHQAPIGVQADSS